MNARYPKAKPIDTVVLGSNDQLKVPSFYRKGDYIVTETTNNIVHPYTLTHAPTTLSVGFSSSLRKAKTFANEMAKLKNSASIVEGVIVRPKREEIQLLKTCESKYSDEHVFAWRRTDHLLIVPL